ncbi:MAG: TIGR03663 family protein [bacterium]|nr:TIGR03663 family protein [bacterium]
MTIVQSTPSARWERLVNRPLRLSKEQTAWLCLFAVVLLSRFIALDQRVMSHDESMWAYYSHAVAVGQVYRQDPVLHGPLLCHVNGLLLRLVGSNDFTARITPAAAGVCVVVMILLFRRYLGRTGALAAAVLVTISPILLFYSRYLRNDIYVALFGLVWLFCSFRYIEERRPVWLVPLTVAMALSFATKETSIIFGAIVGVFMVVRSVDRALRRIELLRDSASYDLAGLMLVLVLPFAASLVHLALGWDPTDSDTAVGLRRSAAAIAAAFALSVAVGMVWFRRRAKTAGQLGCSLSQVAMLMLVFWSLQVTLFSSFFRNLASGTASGIVGSFGYWLLQHEVARGGQPWFYYLMLGGLYEFLPLILCGVGALVLFRQLLPGRRPASGEATRAVRAPSTSARSFLVFCLWWWLASWLAYTVAGEKMPWLLTHLTIPACLLGGWWIGRTIDRVDWGRMGMRRSLLLVVAPSLYVLLASRLMVLSPFQVGVEATAATGRWLFWLVGTSAVVLVIFLVVRTEGFRQARGPLGIGLTVLLALLTARFAAMASYVNYDLPIEPLVYAHGTPDVRFVLEEISLLEREPGLEGGLRVAFGRQTTWPFIWYFRDRSSTLFYGDTPGLALARAHLVIVGDDNLSRVWPYLAQDFVKRDYRLRWWPLEGYRDASLHSIWSGLSKPDARRRFWQIIWRREYGVDVKQWPLAERFQVWRRRDLVERADAQGSSQ